MKTIRFALTTILGVTFVLAAVAKALEPMDFAEAVVFLLPRNSLSPASLKALILFVVATEASLGIWILLTNGARKSLYASLGVLFVFSIALFRLVADPDAPACGCLGAGTAGQSETVLAIVRNGSMIWMGCWILMHKREQTLHLPTRAAGHTVAGDSVRGKPGFTLIELILTIGLIAVLISLSLPAISSARQSAKNTLRLNTMRQIAVATNLYSTDNDDGFPFLGETGDPLAPIFYKGVRVPGQFFRIQAMYWANLIWPDYLHGPRSVIEREDVRDARVRGVSIGSSIVDDLALTEVFLTHSAAAAPRFFKNDENNDPVSLDFSLYRGMKIGDIRYPSDKGILIDGTGLSFLRTRLNAFVIEGDLSARQLFIPRNGLDERYVVARPYGAMTMPVMTTRNGLEGVDWTTSR